MTADRCLALLRDLKTLAMMRQHLATFDWRDDTRDAWRLVLVAIDDRCALLTGVLSFEAPDVLQACERQLACERQQAAEGDASSALLASPLSLNATNAIGNQPRVTIH